MTVPTLSQDPHQLSIREPSRQFAQFFDLGEVEERARTREQVVDQALRVLLKYELVGQLSCGMASCFDRRFDREEDGLQW
jgi:hypothetical protein